MAFSQQALAAASPALPIPAQRSVPKHRPLLSLGEPQQPRLHTSSSVLVPPIAV
ncbi:hypothetical protein OAO87_04200 [bacterium]|nr:hypothetical protein [bacterium]